MEPTKITSATPLDSALSDDTICAISTPPGVGGIAVARISGPRAIPVADAIFDGRHTLADTPANTVRFGTVLDTRRRPLDQALVAVFRAPASFTGQDTVEISVHGSRYVQAELLASLQLAGARLAEPGEFTRRAFTSGKMDLAEAEAVADIIASRSRAAHDIALRQMRGHISRRLTLLRDKLLELSALIELELDFSEEDVQFADRAHLLRIATDIYDETSRLAGTFHTGAAIKEGIPVAIIGATNAGKSSMLNTLLGDNRAIVSDIHGTTRDTIEELLPIGDYTFRFIDTAGLRATTDSIELLGIDLTHAAARRAGILIPILDPTQPFDTTDATLALAAEHPDSAVIAVINKIDIATPAQIRAVADAITRVLPDATVIEASTLTGSGIADITAALTRITDDMQSDAPDRLLITNARHARALTLAAESTARIISGLSDNLSGDFIAQDIRQTIHHLSAITGAISTPEILATIFSRFCIGK